MKRTFTFLLLLLMALAAGAVPVVYTLQASYAATDTVAAKVARSVASFYSRATAGDTLRWVENYSAGAEIVTMAGTKGGLVLDMAGYSTTTSETATAVDAWIALAGADNAVIMNGTITGQRKFGIIYATGSQSTGCILKDLTIVQPSGSTTRTIYFGTVDSPFYITNVACTYGTVGLYATGPSPRVNGFTATNCGRGIQFTGPTSGYIRNATITGATTEGITLAGSGAGLDSVATVTLTGCTANISCTNTTPRFRAITATGGTRGIYLTAPTDGYVRTSSFTTTTAEGVYVLAGVLDSLVSCTFTRCQSGIRLGASVTSGAWDLHGHTITDANPYGINLDADGTSVVVRDCTFGRIKYKNYHGIMVGRDTGDDVANTFAVTIRDNDWVTSSVNDTLTLYNVHCIVVKAKGVKIYNNNVYSGSTITKQGAQDNFTFLYYKGAQSCSAYNNRVNVPDMVAFRYGPQTTTGCKLSTLYNNFAGPLCPYFIAAIDDSMLAVGNGVVIGNNCTSGLSWYSYDQSAAVALTALNAATFLSSNFTDSTSWRRQWGGRGALTGMTDSAQGFQAVGISTASPGQPAISRTQPGFRTPKESLESIRSIGALKGVDLDAYIVTPQDRANLKVWQYGPHPAGGTLQATGADTLRVRTAIR